MRDSFLEKVRVAVPLHARRTEDRHLYHEVEETPVITRPPLSSSDSLPFLESAPWA